MATFETGNMWSRYNKTDLFCITTNASIGNDGCLVMGRGIALEAKKRLPGIALLLGQSISRFGKSEYGLLVEYYPNDHLYIAAFQVKYSWRDSANLDLIHLSTSHLIDYIRDISPSRVDLNFPGIGNGKLDESVVFPIIAELPDCVHVWRYA